MASLNFKEALTATWYFKGYFEKIFLTLGSISLVYSLIRIIAQGIW